jgi:hypothetical protein
LATRQHLGITLGHVALNVDGATHGVDADANISTANN